VIVFPRVENFGLYFIFRIIIIEEERERKKERKNISFFKEKVTINQ
jgi:hypothetical protein